MKKIDQNLFIAGASVNGRTTMCHTAIKNIPIDSRTKLDQIIIEIRSIEIALMNLNDAQNTLKYLIQNHYSEHTSYPQNPQQYEFKAMLSHGLLLLRSCFVDGKGNKNKVDLVNLFRNNETYLNARRIVDKCYAHIDENHEVRSIDVSWEFKVEENNMLIPQRPYFHIKEFHSLHKDDVSQIIDLVIEIKTFLRCKMNDLTKEVNCIIGGVKMT